VDKIASYKVTGTLDKKKLFWLKEYLFVAGEPFLYEIINKNKM